MNSLLNKYLSTDFENATSLKESYVVFSISYFDHWLTEDEYVNANLICYVDVEEDQTKSKSFGEISERFVSFYEELYKLAERDVIQMKNGKAVLLESYSEYRDCIINAMKESPLCELLYPRLNLFSVTGYDLTHTFYILKESSQSALFVQQKIEGSAHKNGLHLLQ